MRKILCLQLLSWQWLEYTVTVMTWWCLRLEIQIMFSNKKGQGQCQGRGGGHSSGAFCRLLSSSPLLLTTVELFQYNKSHCPPFSSISMIGCITALRFVFIPWHFAPFHYGLDDVCPLHDCWWRCRKCGGVATKTKSKRDFHLLMQTHIISRIRVYGENYKKRTNNTCNTQQRT